MTVPPSCWRALWDYWLTMSAEQSQALWVVLPLDAKNRCAYWLGKSLSTRPDSAQNASAIRRCLATIPPARLVEALEAAVACGMLERAVASSVEEMLLAGVSKDGVWL